MAGTKEREKYLDDIRQELTKRKLELEQILTDISQEKLSDDQVQDLGDQAMAATMETLRSSYQQTEHEEYSSILKALETLDKGTYGMCSDCRQSISEKRLKYNPNAGRCLPCQEIVEGKL